MANFKIPDKPLTTAEVNQRVYEMMDERTRLHREFLCRYKDNILSETRKSMAKRCTSYIDSKDDFEKCIDEQKLYNDKNIEELKKINCSDYPYITFKKVYGFSNFK